MTSEPEMVADHRCLTGEGPLYDPDADLLYWVDIPAGKLFSYDPESGTNQVLYERDGAIGGLTLETDGSLLLFEDGGRIERFDGQTTTVVDGIDGEEDSRFNDVIADPAGRVFCGTMPTEDRDGRLYRLETDGSVKRLRSDVKLPNGFGFTQDRETLYFTESEAGIIRSYDYNQSSGEISGGDVVIDVSGEAGIPDGLTVDSTGDLWSARWDGNCLVRYSPDGRERERIEFPARKVSSVQFGGQSFETAYVTTALGFTRENDSIVPNDRREEGSGAGALFAVEPGVEGRPEFRSAVTTSADPLDG